MVGETFYLDEVLVRTRGIQHYHLWRSIDQDGEVVDLSLQRRMDGKAARRFFKRLCVWEMCGGRMSRAFME